MSSSPNKPAHNSAGNPPEFLPKEMADLMNLSDKERRIFEVIGGRQMGARAGKISEITGLGLTTVAYILRKLEKRGRVRRFQIGGKRDFWTCERRLKNGQLARRLGESVK